MQLPSAALDPEPLIDGNDLRDAGLPRGPLFGTILTAVRAAQLDGRLSTREQALDMARSMAEQPPGTP